MTSNFASSVKSSDFVCILLMNDWYKETLSIVFSKKGISAESEVFSVASSCLINLGGVGEGAEPVGLSLRNGELMRGVVDLAPRTAAHCVLVIPIVNISIVIISIIALMIEVNDVSRVVCV